MSDIGSTVELISSTTCPFAQRSRMVLLTKGIDFKVTEISLDDKPDWFLEISPYAKVPVLRHHDSVFYESAVINEYIEDTFPHPPLLPQEPSRRALARIWIAFANDRMVPHVYKMMLRQDAAGQQVHRERLEEAVLQMEFEGLRKLSSGPFWFGDTPNLVDFTFFPHVQRFGVLKHYRHFNIPDECERLRTWLAAMNALPAVQATKPSDETLIKNWSKYAFNTSTGTTARDMRDI